ncbi:MAG: Crp/Fnr family transcriptional regulator [Anaerolineales bacterium]
MDQQNVLIGCLERAPIFSKLGPVDREALAGSAVRRDYRIGQSVCWQGEPWPKAAVVVSGSLNWAMLSPGGKRQVVASLGPDDVIWGHTLLDDKPMPASIEVMAASTLYEWRREDVVPLVSAHAEAAWDISRLMVGYMRRARDVIYGFAFQPVAGRLARLLLDHYQPIEGEPTARELTLDEMAARVGTNREFISRTLHQLSDQGVIEISRVEFILTNRERLEQLAGQDKD